MSAIYLSLFLILIPVISAVNIALHKTAGQIGVYGGAAADRAVDGNYDQNDGRYLSVCAHPDTTWYGGVPAQWWVDLGADHYIADVTVWNTYDDGSYWRMNKFYVEVVSSDNSTRASCGTYNGLSAVPRGGSHTFNCYNARGRYVYIIKQESDHQRLIAICEVLVQERYMPPTTTMTPARTTTTTTATTTTTTPTLTPTTTTTITTTTTPTTTTLITFPPELVTKTPGTTTTTTTTTASGVDDTDGSNRQQPVTYALLASVGVISTICVGLAVGMTLMAVYYKRKLRRQHKYVHDPAQTQEPMPQSAISQPGEQNMSASGISQYEEIGTDLRPTAEEAPGADHQAYQHMESGVYQNSQTTGPYDVIRT